MDGEIYHATKNKNKSRGALLILDKAGIKARKVFIDKKGHYIIIKINYLKRHNT